jgi:DNA-binding NarL/FixJ family response regulator
MENDTRIRVVIGCFHDLFGSGLRGLIEGDSRFEVLPVRVTPHSLETALARWLPSLVILSEHAALDAPELGRLLANHPSLQLIIFAQPPTSSYQRRLEELGVTVISTAAASSEVLATCQLVGVGRCVGAGRRHDRDWGAMVDTLTHRELDVLACLEEGMTDFEIAKTLHVTVATVRTHTASIRRKLGIASRRVLVRRFVERKSATANARGQLPHSPSSHH